MGALFQLILLSTVGAFLLWLGYTLFVGLSPRRPVSAAQRPPDPPTGIVGAPRTCPVCAARLTKGERVRSSAFPSIDGGDRLMHIFGCPYCTTLNFPRERTCPVCGKNLPPNAYLIARLFDKPGRSHVHVLGCTLCRGPRAKG